MSAPAPPDRGPRDQVELERHRLFQSGRWSGPVGITAAVGFYSVLISATSAPPSPLRWWVVAMLVGVAVQIAAFVVPRLAGQLDRHGLPAWSNVGYLLVGCGWGSLLWLDFDATRATDVRWITLATLFAMSAGIVSGISGVNLLGAAVFIPMWIGATSALAATGNTVTAAGCAVFAAISFRDMTRNGSLWTELIERRVASHQIAEANVWAATHDPMTALVNRNGFMEQLTERADAAPDPISVMFIDLDHFKEVNDHLGHAAGDEVLVETANRLSASLRPSDVIGRLGGDEFCVLLGPEHDEKSSDSLGHRLIDELERPFDGPWGDERVYISASVGIARLDPADATPERLLLDADHAMYEAKRAGRRRVVHFATDPHGAHAERPGLESDFRRAIRESLIEADGQPIFDISSGQVGCVELLARWRLPGGGSIPPSVFIPLAEDLGLIGDLTNSMLRKAGACLQDWSNHPVLSAAKVSVNVSADDIARGRLASTAADVVSEFDIAPGRLVLELTESMDLAGSPSDLAQFEALRGLGIDVAIDDFGSGYSSLEHLLGLPIAAVKLDSSLIGNLGTDPRQLALLRSIYDLAAVIGPKVIVEGVETQAQLDQLRRLDVRLAQGYFLCRPVPVEELDGHLEVLPSVLGESVNSAIRPGR